VPNDAAALLLTILACCCSCGASHTRADGGLEGDGGSLDTGHALDGGRFDVEPRDARLPDAPDAPFFWPVCGATSPCEAPRGVTLLGSLDETSELPAGMYLTDGVTGCAAIVVRRAPDGGLDLETTVRGPGWSIGPPPEFRCGSPRDCELRSAPAGEYDFVLDSCGYGGSCLRRGSERFSIDPSSGFVRRSMGTDTTDCPTSCDSCPP
jgi:hypothetical protein